MLAAGTADDDMVFRFIPLPEEYITKPDPQSQRRPAEEYCTMSCIDRETIVFVCLDSYSQGHPIDKATLTTWTLKFLLTNHWVWEKDGMSPLCVGDLLDDLPITKDDRKLLIPSCSVISIDRAHHVVTYLRVTKFEYKRERGHWGAATGYDLSIDMYGGKVLNWSSPSQVRPYSQILRTGTSLSLSI
ncbi:hypothetical protein BAE44_0025833 [Dichanthelium oligosanthes]|uniref:DUF1618 domain-containing protein n=1 Tax=Dichanthelium oligosanthes TaxID=888268 RepID=A0A1E5UJX2_9POAL|nr:hypothetical protein BAE44_0025833 [Dichanthelium oligosanthes]